MEVSQHREAVPVPVGSVVAMGRDLMSGPAERLWGIVRLWPAYPWNLLPLGPIDTYGGASVVAHVSITRPHASILEDAHS